MTAVVRENLCRNRGLIDSHKGRKTKRPGKRPFSCSPAHKAIMSYRVLNLAGGICAALWLLAAATGTGISPALAQNNDAKPADQQSAAPKEGAKDNGKDSAKDSAKDGTKEPQKID